jgi:hypothetical protein
MKVRRLERGESSGNKGAAGNVDDFTTAALRDRAVGQPQSSHKMVTQFLIE